MKIDNETIPSPPSAVQRETYIIPVSPVDIIQRPKGKSVVTYKWIYKIKHAADESVKKYKTRSIARCFLINRGSCL
jgi:hypothetical protein